MRALVVGYGSIGRRHAQNWARLGLGDVRAARDFPTLELALHEFQPDAVLVTNPTSLHVETTCQAVAAGAHVLIEKPVSHSLVGVTDLLARASESRRKLAVGYNLRFHPGMQRLRHVVRSGGIGQPLYARAEVGEYLPDWHPSEDYRASYAARRELGGGPVLTLSHDLDALWWVLGAPSGVTAVTSRSGSLQVDTEDVAEIILQFDSGTLGSVHLDYLRRDPRRFLEVSGEDGIVRWEYEANRVVQYVPATRAWRIEQGDPTFVRNDMYLAELAAFARWIDHSDTEPPLRDAESPSCATPEPWVLADAEQGAAVLAIALAALDSAAAGRTVDLHNAPEPTKTWLSRL